MTSNLKAIVWRLPTGAGGAAAQFYAYKLTQEVSNWRQTHNINQNTFKWVTVNWYRGIKSPHKILTMPEEYATMFLLSWTGKLPTYIDEYVHPDEH